VSRGSGKIEVSSRVIGTGIEIRVSDNGTGVPESIRESLFQPFVSHGKEKGIGLGLTVVRKIMQDHGGEVRVESTGPQGSTFILFFPARHEALQEVNS
jgi:signal transduction histidine kinase